MNEIRYDMIFKQIISIATVELLNCYRTVQGTVSHNYAVVIKRCNALHNIRHASQLSI